MMNDDRPNVGCRYQYDRRTLVVQSRSKEAKRRTIGGSCKEKLQPTIFGAPQKARKNNNTYFIKASLQPKDLSYIPVLILATTGIMPRYIREQVISN